MWFTCSKMRLFFWRHWTESIDLIVIENGLRCIRCNRRCNFSFSRSLHFLLLQSRSCSRYQITYKKKKKTKFAQSFLPLFCVFVFNFIANNRQTQKKGNSNRKTELKIVMFIERIFHLSIHWKKHVFCFYLFLHFFCSIRFVS